MVQVSKSFSLAFMETAQIDQIVQFLTKFVMTFVCGKDIFCIFSLFSLSTLFELASLLKITSLLVSFKFEFVLY